MSKKKRLVICEPMQGKSFEEIEKRRSEFVKTLNLDNFEIVGNLTPPKFIEDENDVFSVKHRAVYCLGQSIDAISRADVVMFREGWEKARGCKIEHAVASAYGLEIMYEEKVE